MSITMIGLDTAKSVFQLHGIDASGKAQLRRKLRRSELIPFFEGQPRCTVVMEACGAAHHWARVLSGLGHEVKLVAPEAVRPFVKRGKKNDAADAAAICAAASRPDAKFVPVKSLEQQGVLALHSARALLVKQQTMLANAMRGLATEFGLVVSKGMSRLEELAALVAADETFPGQARQVFIGLLDQCRATADRIAAGLSRDWGDEDVSDMTGRDVTVPIGCKTHPRPRSLSRQQPVQSYRLRPHPPISGQSLHRLCASPRRALACGRGAAPVALDVHLQDDGVAPL